MSTCKGCYRVVPGHDPKRYMKHVTATLFPNRGEGLREAARTIPLRRVGRPSEIATLIRFLTSDDASYITGQAIIADGGLTVRWPG